VRARRGYVERVETALGSQALNLLGEDLQRGVPEVPLGLSRVGITGAETLIRIIEGGLEETLPAELECYVDLGPGQRGAHMSRFEESLDTAIAEPGSSAGALAAQIAELVRARQGASRAEVRIAARRMQRRPAPASAAPSHDPHTVLGAAVARATGTRYATGVRAQGMTACPCAQETVAARSRARLLEEGYDVREIDRILTLVPVATHNQRGIGTLWMGSDPGGGTGSSALLEIVEDSMSSEIHELMKRSDEADVVEKAHRRPRFVEDCVRDSLRAAVQTFGALGDETFLMARQENLETIHRHNVVAERHGLLADLRGELDSTALPAKHLTLAEWLDGGPAAA